MSKKFMPPDVFLMLASSGLGFVASLLFFVSEEQPPAAGAADQAVTYCDPPPRPPPMPLSPTVVVEGRHGTYTLRCEAGEWVVRFIGPADHLASSGAGSVNDLRWQREASFRRVGMPWKPTPGHA